MLKDSQYLVQPGSWFGKGTDLSVPVSGLKTGAALAAEGMVSRSSTIEQHFSASCSAGP
jgi:hypothetical protein